MRRQPSDENQNNVRCIGGESKFFKKSASMEAKSCTTTPFSQSNESLKSAIPVRTTPLSGVNTEHHQNATCTSKFPALNTGLSSTETTSAAKDSGSKYSEKKPKNKSSAINNSHDSKEAQISAKALNLPSAKSGHDEVPCTSRTTNKFERLLYANNDKRHNADSGLTPPSSSRSSQSTSLGLKFRIKRNADKERSTPSDSKTDGHRQTTFLPHSMHGLLTPSRVTSKVTATLIGKNPQKSAKSSQTRSKNSDKLLKKAVSNQKSLFFDSMLLYLLVTLPHIELFSAVIFLYCGYTLN